jgi:hypothetical protein
MKDKDTAVLERIQIHDIDPDKLVTRSVLQYAENNIGYKHPQRDRQIGQGTLAEALRVVGIKPFTSKSVNHYKAKKANQFGTKKIIARRVFLPFVWMVTIPATAFLFLDMMNGLNNPKLSPNPVLIHFFMWSIPLMIVTAILGIRYGTTRDKECRWVGCDLKQYDEPVPEFALATAVELHQRVPGIEFRIDEFRVEAKSRDPFLVAVFKSECYYLEVWDEPGYKQERKA